MLKFVEERTGMTTQQFLQLHKADYRAYCVEDGALLTSVFFNHARGQLCAALRTLNEILTDCVKRKFRGQQGTARLGFSTEKELFNIFHLQLFGAEFFGKAG